MFLRRFRDIGRSMSSLRKKNRHERTQSTTSTISSSASPKSPNSETQGQIQNDKTSDTCIYKYEDNERAKYIENEILRLTTASSIAMLQDDNDDLHSIARSSISSLSPTVILSNLEYQETILTNTKESEFGIDIDTLMIKPEVVIAPPQQVVFRLLRRKSQGKVMAYTSIYISNKSHSQCLAYKIKTSNFPGYLVTPVRGLIAMENTIEIVIYLCQPEGVPVDYFMRSKKDQFLIEILPITAQRYGHLMMLSDDIRKEEIANLWSLSYIANRRIVKLLTCKFVETPRRTSAEATVSTSEWKNIDEISSKESKERAYSYMI